MTAGHATGIPRALTAGVLAGCLVVAAALTFGAVDLLVIAPVVAGAVAHVGLRRWSATPRPLLVAASLTLALMVLGYLVAFALAIAAFPEDFDQMM